MTTKTVSAMAQLNSIGAAQVDGDIVNGNGRHTKTDDGSH